MKWTKKIYNRVLDLFEDNTYNEIADKLRDEFGIDKSGNAVKKAYQRYTKNPELLENNGGFGDKRNVVTKKPKILLFDIETLPMEAYVWGLWDQTIGLNMIKHDWSVLSWSAKWYGEDEIFYEDVRKQKNLRDDSKVLVNMHKLLDEADIVVGHNSDQFDVKKLNARFILNGMQPPSGYKRLDTKKLAKRHFGFTSNKLAYLTDKLCKKYKKLSHGKFPGFSLWEQCLERNMEAFDEMEEYNRYDVLSLEELFSIMLPWESSQLFQVYGNEIETRCTCGSTEFKKSGFHYTGTGKYQKHKCKQCGSEYRDRENLLSKEDKKKLKGRSSR